MPGSDRLRLQEAISSCQDPVLRKTIPYGVGAHNASLQTQDRQLVEQLFREGMLRVLCATTTLAQGCNFPAHLVIIKSTQIYHSGRLVEYDPNLIIQMMGRAGRPQYDEYGKAVIMTQTKSKPYYDHLVKGSHETVESQLRASFIEHVNAEVIACP